MQHKILALIASLSLLLVSCGSNIPSETDYKKSSESIESNKKSSEKFNNTEIDNSSEFEATEAPNPSDSLSGETATNTSFNSTGATGTGN